MEPTVVVALVGAAALVALVARGRRPTPEAEPMPVRVDDDPAPRRRN